jgi:bifunctional ADP-heptose synthase (sugar kinase/adenylyltransferase)
VREAAHAAQKQFPGLLVLADSRRSLREFPAVTFKMNAAEIAALAGEPSPLARDRIAAFASDLARRNKQPVFITLAEQGILGALPDGSVHHTPSFPVRGPIDIVGAGDAVTANLTAALAAKANPEEAMQLAMAAASVVVHQLGTTGEAAATELAALILSREPV